MKKTIIVLIFITVVFYSRSNAYYIFDKNLEQSYNAILSLHFNEAERSLEKEKLERPGNDLRLLYLNYIDFLKAIITEERSQYELLKKNSASRLNLINIDKRNSLSPFHLYVQSEIMIQQALVGIKFEDNIASAAEVRKAFRLITKNEKDFPSFILNDKILGFLHAVIGSVPLHYQWLVRLAGMNGDITRGMKELQSTCDKISGTEFDCYRTEILFYMGNLYSVFSMTSDSISLPSQLKPLVTKSPLIAYIYTNIMTKMGKNEEALLALNTSIKDGDHFPFDFLYYKRGLARLRKMDLSSAEDFEYFLSHYKGVNNIKSAYQKLAWISLLKGDTAGYKADLSLCRQTGKTILDEDKEAQTEAMSDQVMNIFLLRSRLYFDGGYYQRAISEITGNDFVNFPRYRDHLEVTYRLGRIMQMTGQIDKAITYFEMTIKNGEMTRYYFAANSSLMLGGIYEEKKQTELAKKYYRKCLSLDFDQYKNGIDQKAQAGLDRLKSQN